MKIPTYDSGLSPTVVTPSPKSGASPVGEALQSVGSILGNVSEDLMQAERLRQASAKELEYERGYNEILEEAEKRPLDDEYVPYFTDKIKTLTQNSQTKNPQANELLQRVIGLKNLDLEHKVRGFYAKKVEGESIAQLNDKIALLEPRYYGVNTGDKKEDAYDREDILNELGFAINNRFETGIFTKPEAQKLFNDTIKNWKGEGQFNYDLGQAQSVEDLEAIGKLVKKDYYGKDPKTKNSFSNAVKTGINRLDDAIEEQKETDRITALIQAGTDLVNGDFTFKKLKDLKGIIKPEDEALLAISPPEEAKVTIRAQALTDLIQKYIEDDSPEMASNLLTGAIKQYGEGKLTPVELGIILDNTKTFIDKRKNPPKGFWKTIINWNKNLYLYKKEKTEAVAEAVINTFNRALQLFKEGKPEQEAAHQAIEESKALINPNMTKYKIGDVIVRGGKSFVVTGYRETDGEPIFDER